MDKFESCVTDINNALNQLVVSGTQNCFLITLIMNRLNDLVKDHNEQKNKNE